MNKIAVLYWSQTGNTQQMAEALAQGAAAAGAEVTLKEVSQIAPQEALAYGALALGCPAMGAEVLEEGTFEPFFTALEAGLSGRTVALFGSYGWGDGQWMRDWQQRCEAAGAKVAGGEGLILCGTPDGGGLEACKKLGARLCG